MQKDNETELNEQFMQNFNKMFEDFEDEEGISDEEDVPSLQSYYFDTHKDDDDMGIPSEQKFIKSKTVSDSDGFSTDYTMYKDDEGYFFIFGDNELYGADREYADWECDTKEQADEWFDNYNGFDEEDHYVDDFDESANREYFIDGKKQSKDKFYDDVVQKDATTKNMIDIEDGKEVSLGDKKYSLKKDSKLKESASEYSSCKYVFDVYEPDEETLEPIKKLGTYTIGIQDLVKKYGLDKIESLVDKRKFDKYEGLERLARDIVSERFHQENPHQEFVVELRREDFSTRQMSAYLGRKLMPPYERRGSRNESRTAHSKMSLNEDLFDDVQSSGEPKGMPQDGQDITISNMLIDNINGEWDTIRQYNDLISALQQAGKDEQMCDVIRDIVNEENTHIGQLQQMLETLSPNTASIADGQKEGQEQLGSEIAKTVI